MALIGCGQMGQALAHGWLKALPEKGALVTVDRHPEKRSDFYQQTGVPHFPSLKALAGSHKPAALCLAVKPYQLEEILPQVRSAFADCAPLILTVIAGKHTDFYASHLWDNAAIIRIMPNTPSQIGEGMSGCFASGQVTHSQRAAADALMRSAGHTLWLEDEAQMHALTAISGSGPAYVFYLMEVFLSAAEGLGFSPQDARLLVNQTFAGAALMARQSPLDITELRHNVTSPNGTTQAGLDVLMQQGLERIAKQTLLAAKSRSETLMSE